MTSPLAFRSHRLLTGLVLSATAVLAACAPESGDVDPNDEHIAETSQQLVGEWEWHDVPNTKCGNGSQTGFGINVGTSSDIVIYLEGGSACWDDVTCNAGLASYFTSGYDGTTFKGQRKGIFDRTNAANPYKNSTIVYVPYCTGDFHSGDTVRGANKSLNFNGRLNLELDLAQVHDAFPTPSRVTLVGASAGGFGALFNYERVTEVFASTRVDLVTDSSPVLWDSAVGFTGVSQWNTKAALPAGCPECATSKRSLYAYYANKFPNSRFAYLGYDLDPVMAVAAYGELPVLYREELRKFVFTTLKPLPNWKHFVAAGSDHTTIYSLDISSQNVKCSWLFGLCFPTSYGPTVTLADWLTKMYTDDPTWAKQSALIE